MCTNHVSPKGACTKSTGRRIYGMVYHRVSTNTRGTRNRTRWGRQSAGKPALKRAFTGPQRGSQQDCWLAGMIAGTTSAHEIMTAIIMPAQWRTLAVAISFAFFLWSAPNSPISFKSDVAPILEKNCLACHGPARQMSMLDLSNRAAALKGGQKGPAIIPGNASGSPLYRRLTGQDKPAMPLGGKLSATEIATVQKWIDAGAAWDEAVSSEQDRNWWAFRRSSSQTAPRMSEARWNANPIDAFLKKALDEKGLEPAPRAGRRTLLRRAYLDLIGLLPSPREVEAFVNDNTNDAWEKRIDELLASTHYGERWGRHWLDVARYADSWGHIHDDDNAEAWRY